MFGDCGLDNKHRELSEKLDGCEFQTFNSMQYILTDHAFMTKSARETNGTPTWSSYLIIIIPKTGYSDRECINEWMEFRKRAYDDEYDESYILHGRGDPPTTMTSGRGFTLDIARDSIVISVANRTPVDT